MLRRVATQIRGKAGRLLWRSLHYIIDLRKDHLAMPQMSLKGYSKRLPTGNLRCSVEFEGATAQIELIAVLRDPRSEGVLHATLQMFPIFLCVDNARLAKNPQML